MSNELNISMKNTLISESDQKAMLEMVKPKRVKRFKEDYIQELTLAKMDNHTLKLKLRFMEERVRQFEQVPTVLQATKTLAQAIAKWWRELP